MRCCKVARLANLPRADSHHSQQEGQFKVSKQRICLIGEVMVELSRIDCAQGQAAVGVAGDTYNSAVHLARLLPPQDWSVEYVTLLGRDGLSDQIVSCMQAEGVSTKLVGRHPDRLPGLYAIELDAKGERSFRYWRSVSAARRLFSDGDLSLTALDGAKAVFLSLITLAILPSTVQTALLAKLASLRAQGCVICFDSNYRPALWPDVQSARQACTKMWAVTDIGLPSRDDEAALWSDESAEDVINRLTALNVGEIAMKNGASGPQLWRNGPLVTGSFATAARVVDTSGAGDAFNGGYLAARLQGLEPQDAALCGHALAVRVIGRPGAIPPHEH